MKVFIFKANIGGLVLALQCGTDAMIFAECQPLEPLVTTYRLNRVIKTLPILCRQPSKY